MKIILENEMWQNATKQHFEMYDVVYLNKKINDKHIKVCCTIIDRDFFYNYPVAFIDLKKIIKSVEVENKFNEIPYFDLEKHLLGNNGGRKNKIVDTFKERIVR